MIKFTFSIHHFISIRQAVVIKFSFQSNAVFIYICLNSNKIILGIYANRVYVSIYVSKNLKYYSYCVIQYSHMVSDLNENVKAEKKLNSIRKFNWWNRIIGIWGNFVQILELLYKCIPLNIFIAKVSCLLFDFLFFCWKTIVCSSLR